MKRIAAAAFAASLTAGCASSVIPVPGVYYEHTSCNALGHQLEHFERGTKRINAHFDERGKLFDDGNEGMRRGTLARYDEHRKTMEAVHATRCR